MTEANQITQITRRGFVRRGAEALATAGIFASMAGASDAGDSGQNQETAKSNAAALPPRYGKIILEEHFALPEGDNTYQASPTPDFQLQMVDLGERRLADMDRGGVEICIVSHTAPGVQAILDPSAAIATARRWNDYLAEKIAKYPKRLKGFAALPMQDPRAAAQELTRCVKELGFCGALVNGFSQVSIADSAIYYDLPQYRPFWATVEQLDVPFYLHPRPPLAGRSQAYEGHPWIAGSSWGFAVETSIHALRLMSSGLFDEYPKLRIILGHLGEGLTFGIWRIDNRIVRLKQKTNAKRSMAEYLRENFYLTTSGQFRTQSLTEVILEVGADRVLYSVDYPYEDIEAGAAWFDHAPLAESDWIKIAHGNARKLFRF